MEFLFELSQEHPSLPLAEIEGLLNAYSQPYRILSHHKRNALLELSESQHLLSILAKRLALTHHINQVHFTCKTNLEDFSAHLDQHNFDLGSGSISIRTHNTSEHASEPYIHLLGNHLKETHPVDLTRPDHELRIIITEHALYLCEKKVDIDRSSFEQRKPQHRPFFSPVSLHPRVARALVNLTSLQQGQTLLDPFCGTGGILIEAGYCGLNIIGSDLDDQMILGCHENLTHYGLSAEKLIQADISDLPKKLSTPVDGIATDLPYGRSTSTHGEELISLYKRTFQNLSSLLKPGGIAVVGLSEKEHVAIGEDSLCLQHLYPFRMHKSLTRYFAVYKKE